MNLQALKQALKPKLHETKIDGFTVYIHRPSIKDASNCTTLEAVLVYCVKDENGKCAGQYRGHLSSHRLESTGRFPGRCQICA